MFLKPQLIRSQVSVQRYPWVVLCDHFNQLKVRSLSKTATFQQSKDSLNGWFQSLSDSLSHWMTRHLFKQIPLLPSRTEKKERREIRGHKLSKHWVSVCAVNNTFVLKFLFLFRDCKLLKVYVVVMVSCGATTCCCNTYLIIALAVMGVHVECRDVFRFKSLTFTFIKTIIM